MYGKTKKGQKKSLFWHILCSGWCCFLMKRFFFIDQDFDDSTKGQHIDSSELRLSHQSFKSLMHPYFTFYFDISLTLFIHWMTLNCIKVRRTDTFMKYLASVFSLLFLQETLIWNKVTFLASNLLNLAELVANELMKSISKKITNVYFLFDLSLLNTKIARVYNWINQIIE